MVKNGIKIFFASSVLIVMAIAIIGCVQTKSDEESRSTPVIPSVINNDNGGATSQLDPALQNQSPPPGAKNEFKTDFSISLIDFKEVISGGPPKNGIPAIREPQFDTVDAADSWLQKNEMVFVFSGAPYGSDETHIYPVQILIYHEIVNDRFNNIPIIITYCPLCNSALAFLGVVENQQLSFGVSGRLRFSNMIMYDDQTESWWQQATGKAVVGDFVGERLEIVPLLTLSWGEARASFPNAQVLSQNTGARRPYGRNPYVGYDTLDHPFLYRGKAIDSSRNPFARVIVATIGGEERAYLYAIVRDNIVTHDVIADRAVVLLWSNESVSPLDEGQVASGRVVGSANIFFPVVLDMALTFVVKNGTIIDEQTESIWNSSGIAISGQLQGERLMPAPSIQHFWFSYTAFSEEGA